MKAEALVTVVIPAYNVAGTLDETLRSVRSQTHQALEILVIDDGSSDGTAAVAMEHSAADSRVSLISQKNAGLAAARNAGWKSAKSELIAFVDADDLWSPTKIERQVQALDAGGEGVGLVYCWYVPIDVFGNIIHSWEGSRVDGRALPTLLEVNFVGNGSSAMFRRQALVDANGFEGKLRNAGAEGCEDWLICCRVAERYDYAVVPEHLVGYRMLPNNMSSNRPRMLRSWLLAHDELLARHPSYRKPLRVGVRNYAYYLLQGAFNLGHEQVPAILALLFRRYPIIGYELLLREVPKALIRKLLAKLRRRLFWHARSHSVQSTRRFEIGSVNSR